MSNGQPAHHILSVLVENRPGVLARVSGLFARRGYNIFSLAVAPTEDPAMSRITIVVDVESSPLEQIVKQLFKLIDVVKISELDPRRSVERELMIATVRVPAEERGQVVAAHQAPRARAGQVGQQGGLLGARQVGVGGRGPLMRQGAQQLQPQGRCFGGGRI